MAKQTDIMHFLNDPEMIVYKYCYECGIVLGKPDFKRKTVEREALEKHKGHCLAQSEHDGKHGESN